jgi:hypothetical protein
LCGAVPTSAFNINLGSWNTARATTTRGMFYQAVAFNQNLAAWNVVRVTSLTGAFDSTALSSCNKNKLYAAWGTTLRAAYPTFLSAPCVSSFAPVNIQVSSAAAVTISGLGFASVDPSPSAYLSGQPCRTTTWTTATQLVCAAPSPVLATGARCSVAPALLRPLDCRWELQVQHERCGSRSPEPPCARASPSTVCYRTELRHANICTRVGLVMQRRWRVLLRPTPCRAAAAPTR